LESTVNQYPKYFPIAGAKRQRVAVVCASWHADLVARARDALLDELAQLGVAADRVDCFEVPGAFEIPLLAQQLARSGRHAAIVACALVVDGGIYRHEFVAQTVLDALMRIQLDTDVPIISMVLTPQNFHEHEAHQEFFHEHFKIKGAEAAVACVKTLENLRRLVA
jgi:6,7-dimethyl-8-ribityllumazine synthase